MPLPKAWRIQPLRDGGVAPDGAGAAPANVVAGGSDGSNCLDSVEILEYGSDQWIQGSTNTLIIDIEVS